MYLKIQKPQLNNIDLFLSSVYVLQLVTKFKQIVVDLLVTMLIMRKKIMVCRYCRVLWKVKMSLKFFP